MNKSVTVKVAATSANIGGGFDCMGMALNLYHTLTAEISDELIIQSNRDVPKTRENLVYKSMCAVFNKFGREYAVKLDSQSEIPQASGLGSSAACIVAGATAANALLGFPLGEHELVDLCSELDGHPDNVVPAIRGGVTAGYIDENGRTEYVRALSPQDLTVVTATPDFPLHTSESRAALPRTYSREDCVYSLSRAVVTFAALATGKTEMLRAVGDKIHQPYRIPLIAGYKDVERALKQSGAISVFVSGAGPTVAAFFSAPPQKISLPHGWTQRNLSIDNNPVFVRVND